MDPEPKVILAASGMCEGGRIRHHLKHNLWRPECTVLFVGYQAQGTLGRLIVDGVEKVKIMGEEIKVACEIGILPGKSGHADRDGLLDWLKGFEKKPLQVFVNHGENTVTDAFAETIKNELGFEARRPTAARNTICWRAASPDSPRECPSPSPPWAAPSRTAFTSP